MPAAYDDADISALKACRMGTASAEQQRRAMEWIVWAAGTYHRPWRRDPHEASYLAGRREMGCEVVKLMNLRTRDQSASEQG